MTRRIQNMVMRIKRSNFIRRLLGKKQILNIGKLIEAEKRINAKQSGI